MQTDQYTTVPGQSRPHLSHSWQRTGVPEHRRLGATSSTCTLAFTKPGEHAHLSTHHYQRAFPCLPSESSAWQARGKAEGGRALHQVPNSKAPGGLQRQDGGWWSGPGSWRWWREYLKSLVVRLQEARAKWHEIDASLGRQWLACCACVPTAVLLMPHR